MCDDPSVTDLVTRARNDEKQAWDALVERYAPLVWSICRRHGLSDADARDVGESVWLQLAGQLDQFRPPAALGSWLAGATVRECRRARCAVRWAAGAGRMLDAESLSGNDAGPVPDVPAGVIEHELATAERHAALRDAFAQLPPRDQQLIVLLIEDPAMSHAKIGAKLGIPVEHVGPARDRCLGMLRRHPAVAALIGAEAGSRG
jgi:RNA polymerase sigma factor (sigma-70 family)